MVLRGGRSLMSEVPLHGPVWAGLTPGAREICRCSSLEVNKVETGGSSRGAPAADTANTELLFFVFTLEPGVE